MLKAYEDSLEIVKVDEADPIFKKLRLKFALMRYLRHCCLLEEFNEELIGQCIETLFKKLAEYITVEDLNQLNLILRIVPGAT